MTSGVLCGVCGFPCLMDVDTSTTLVGSCTLDFVVYHDAEYLILLMLCSSL
jgi:hypothetical protein